VAAVKTAATFFYALRRTRPICGRHRIAGRKSVSPDGGEGKSVLPSASACPKGGGGLTDTES